MTKQDVLKFLKTKIYTVISTSGSNGQPEAALIAFGETDNFELIFGTYSTSRKYKNLKENNKVAFVIGWDEEYVTVQYEGVATELNESEIEEYYPLYSAKVSSAALYRNHPDQTYWKVTPTWIRYSDLSEGDDITEFKF